MKSAKEEIRELLEQLPEDASLEDIQYHIYVRQKIQNGLEAAREGRLLSQEEVERRMDRVAREVVWTEPAWDDLSAAPTTSLGTPHTTLRHSFRRSEKPPLP